MLIGLDNMLRKILVTWLLIILATSRSALSELSNIRRLGDARDFLEAFNWTNDSLRGLEAVNLNRDHTITCGFQVNYGSTIQLVSYTQLIYVTYICSTERVY